MTTIYDLPCEILRDEIMQHLPSADHKLFIQALCCFYAQFDDDDAARIAQLPLHVAQYCINAGYVDVALVINSAYTEYAYELIMWATDNCEPDFGGDNETFYWYTPGSNCVPKYVIECYNILHGYDYKVRRKSYDHLLAARIYYERTGDISRIVHLLSVKCTKQMRMENGCNYHKLCACTESLITSTNDIQILEIIASLYGRRKVAKIISGSLHYFNLEVIQRFLAEDQIEHSLSHLRRITDIDFAARAHQIAPIHFNVALVNRDDISGQDLIHMVEHSMIGSLQCTDVPSCVYWNDPYGDAAVKYDILDWHIARGGNVSTSCKMYIKTSRWDDIKDNDIIKHHVIGLTHDHFKNFIEPMTAKKARILAKALSSYLFSSDDSLRNIRLAISYIKQFELNINFQQLIKEHAITGNLQVVKVFAEEGFVYSGHAPYHIRLFLRRCYNV